MDIPLNGSFCPLFPDRIGIWSVSFFWREEIQRKTLRARMRTNNNHGCHSHRCLKFPDFSLTFP